MKILKHIHIILAIVLSTSSAGYGQYMKTGYITVKGGNVWYKIIGNSHKTPIVMLHGGPASASFYLWPLQPLGKDRPVIMFDQLGCGHSDELYDTTLMTIESYVEQTHTLLDSLNIKEFYLYGHSWGTMLGIDYYLKYPEGVKGLILASPCLDTKRWSSDADTLIARLPENYAQILNAFKNNKQVDPKDMGSAMKAYFDTYYILFPMNDNDFDTIAPIDGSHIYEYMWGVNEFTPQGLLKNYDRTKELSQVMVPTLYLSGEFDAVRQSTMLYYQQCTPGSYLEIIPKAGHLTMRDNPEENIRIILEFIRIIEQKP